MGGQANNDNNGSADTGADLRDVGGDAPDNPPDAPPDTRDDRDAVPGCSLIDNRCNGSDDDCNGPIDERCCPSPYDWFSTGPAQLEDRAVSPRVVWSPSTNTFLIAWIVTTDQRPEDGWATSPFGSLQYAVFDLDYAPVGFPGEFVDAAVARFAVSETSDGFQIVYAHANPQDQGPDTILSLVRVARAGDIAQRTRVADTNGIVTRLAVSLPDRDRFLIAWTERRGPLGSNCADQEGSCILSVVARAGQMPIAEVRKEIDAIPGWYAGLDVTGGPDAGLVAAIEVNDAPRSLDLVWRHWIADFTFEPLHVQSLGAGEPIEDPHIDADLRVTVAGNGDFLVIRTRSGPATVVIHAIDNLGDFRSTRTLATGPAGIRDATVTTVPDPAQGGLTAWTSSSGVDFKMWNQTFDTVIRTFEFRPGPLEFDHRSVSVATVPGVGYVAAIAVGTPTGDQIVFSFLGDDLDRLCGP